MAAAAAAEPGGGRGLPHDAVVHGFSDEQVVDTYRAFSGFLLGQLLLESSIRGAETSPVEVPLDEGDATIPNRDG